DLRTLVEYFGEALETTADGRTESRPFDLRAERLLRMIRDQHSNPHLTLGSVAAALDISVRHATRLLKRETGAAFLVHLHRARVVSARHLLHETTLSVKQVAAAVGYGSWSELGKHFKRLTSNTPASFRQLHAAKKHDG